MKIGIQCDSDERFAEIVIALRNATFVRTESNDAALNLSIILSDLTFCETEESHPCVITKNPDGTTRVECGRHKDMMARARAGLASRKILSMVFQDNSACLNQEHWKG